MKVSAREVARRVVRRVEGGAYLSLSLGGELERSDLEPGDRALATEIAYGVIRHRQRLEAAVASCARRGIGGLSPAVRTALLVAAYQILYLERVPAYAAVDDAVRAVRKLAGPKVAGFANALLRRLDKTGLPAIPASATTAERASIEHSMPAWLIAELEDVVGSAELAEAAAAFNQPAPLWARFDPQGQNDAGLIAEMAAEKPQAEIEPSPLCPGALRLRGFGSPEASPSFLAGRWTVQDIGAQLVTHLAGARPGDTVLDACAGVGGKSIHLAQMVGPGGRVDAADSSRRKLDLLDESRRRTGLDNIRAIEVDLTNAGAAIAESYSLAIVDAPCSGLGVLRRHPEVKLRPGGAHIHELAELQGRLLDGVSERIAAGGVLVYSVCTFTAAEGPEQVAAFVARHPEFTVEAPGGPVDWSQLIDDAGCLRTWPHRHDADGFFAVRLRRASR